MNIQLFYIILFPIVYCKFSAVITNNFNSNPKYSIDVFKQDKYHRYYTNFDKRLKNQSVIVNDANCPTYDMPYRYVTNVDIVPFGGIRNGYICCGLTSNLYQTKCLFLFVNLCSIDGYPLIKSLELVGSDKIQSTFSVDPDKEMYGFYFQPYIYDRSSFMLKCIYSIILYENSMKYENCNEEIKFTKSKNFQLTPITAESTSLGLTHFVINRVNLENDSPNMGIYFASVHYKRILNYNEMPLICKSKTGVIFNTAIHAKILYFDGEVDSSRVNYYTIIIIAKSDSGQYAFCIFHLSNLYEQITRANDECQKGSSSILKLKHVERTDTPHCILKDEPLFVSHISSKLCFSNYNFFLLLSNQTASDVFVLNNTDKYIPVDMDAININGFNKSYYIVIGHENHIFKYLYNATTRTIFSKSLEERISNNNVSYLNLFQIDGDFFLRYAPKCKTETCKSTIPKVIKFPECKYENCITCTNSKFCAFNKEKNICFPKTAKYLKEPGVMTSEKDCLSGIEIEDPKYVEFTNDYQFKAPEIKFKTGQVNLLNYKAGVRSWWLSSRIARRNCRIDSCRIIPPRLTLTLPKFSPFANIFFYNITILLVNLQNEIVYEGNIPLINCNQHETCMDCVKYQEFCGWCLNNDKSSCIARNGNCEGQLIPIQHAHQSVCPVMENFLVDNRYTLDNTDNSKLITNYKFALYQSVSECILLYQEEEIDTGIFSDTECSFDLSKLRVDYTNRVNGQKNVIIIYIISVRFKNMAVSAKSNLELYMCDTFKTCDYCLSRKCILYKDSDEINVCITENNNIHINFVVPCVPHFDSISPSKIFFTSTNIHLKLTGNALKNIHTHNIFLKFGRFTCEFVTDTLKFESLNCTIKNVSFGGLITETLSLSFGKTTYPINLIAIDQSLLKIHRIKPEKILVGIPSQVIIEGEHLDAGSVLQVKFNKQSIEVIERNKNQIILKIFENDETIDFITLTFDTKIDIQSTKQLEVIQPWKTINIPKLSFSPTKGGVEFNFSGNNFDMFNGNIKLGVISHHVHDTYNKTCTVLSPEEISCITPDIPLKEIESFRRRPVREIKKESNDIDDEVELKNLQILFYFDENVIRSREFTLTYCEEPVLQLASKYKLNDLQLFNISGYNKDYKFYILGDATSMDIMRSPNIKKKLFLKVCGLPCEHEIDSNGNIVCTIDLTTAPISISKYGTCVFEVYWGFLRKSLQTIHVFYEKPITTNLPLIESNNKVILIVGLLGGFFILAVVICGFVMFVRKRNKIRKRKQENFNVPGRDQLDDIVRYTSQDSNNIPHSGATLPLLKIKPPALPPPLEDESPDGYVSENDDALRLFRELINKDTVKKSASDIEQVLIPKKCLEIGTAIGQGHFGTVCLATLKDQDDPDNESKWQKVAVKMFFVNYERDSDLTDSLINEATIMKKFHHENVLSLIGISFLHNRQPIIVMPFVEHGSLHSYIRDKTKTFTYHQLLEYGRQIANGMAYISSLNFIHKDLATRNCMIGSKEIVKVADFGLSEEIYKYRPTVQEEKDGKVIKLPIKWMALEVLEGREFTSKSDVWSFGVVIWELLQRGQKPYKDIDNSMLCDYISQGRRLGRPRTCTNEVYTLMTSCWQSDPDIRPAFIDLAEALDRIVNRNVKPARQHDYYNVTQSPGYVSMSSSSNA